MNDAASQFRDAIRAAGLAPPDVIEPGKLCRFPGNGKRSSNRAGWCRLFEDGLGGCFGDWSSGLSETWRAKCNKPYTRAERAAFARRVKAARAHVEPARRARHAEAASRAIAIWHAAAPAPGNHPYLKRKRIPAPWRAAPSQRTDAARHGLHRPDGQSPIRQRRWRQAVALWRAQTRMFHSCGGRYDECLSHHPVRGLGHRL